MPRVLLALLLVLVFAVPSLAEDPPHAAKSKASDDGPRITMDVRDRLATEVIDHIARYARKNVIVSPDIVKARVNLTFDAVPWRAALEQVAKAAGGVLVEEAHGIFRIVTPDKLRVLHDYYRFQHLPKGNPHHPEVLPAAVDALRRALPEGDSLRYVPAEHAVILSARSDRQGAWVALVKALDRPAPGGPVGAGRAHYEQMLRDSRTEIAARYFLARLQDVDASDR